MRSIKKLLEHFGYLAIAGMSFAGCDHPKLERNNDMVQVRDKTENKLVDEIPYIEGYMKSGLCAGYSTRAAKRLFNVGYHRGDAWNLRYHNENYEIDGLEDTGNLEQGDLIGVYYPLSRHNGRLDEMNKPAEYTHVALFLGRKNDKPIILHNFKGPRIESLESFLTENKAKLKAVIKGKRDAFK